MGAPALLSVIPAQAGMGGRRSGCSRAAGAGSAPPTPHLASPLKGGRDELGRGGWWLGWVGSCLRSSCLRRNDGERRRNDGTEGAGMTLFGVAGMRGRDRNGERPHAPARPPVPARAQAHARPRMPAYPRTRQLPQEHSSLPPFRGEVRWGVGCRERLPAIVRAPIAHAAPRPPHTAHLIHRHSGAFLSSFRRIPLVIPAPPSVIPAQAGMGAQFLPAQE